MSNSEDSNSWASWQRLLRAEQARLSEEVAEQREQLVDLRVEIATMRVKLGLLSAGTGGAVVAVFEGARAVWAAVQ